MPNSIYATLGRQHGLVKEMQVVANNLANASTTGFKSDRTLFAEFIVETGSQTQSLSMGGLAGHAFDLKSGPLKPTGGRLDVALQGAGFFMVQTDAGERLTRAGHFQLSQAGELVDARGSRVLGQGGGPIAFPPNAERISISPDGAVSVDGAPLGQMRIVTPDGQLLRDTDSYFSAPDGVVPAQDFEVVQGALEASNVSPVLEVARMIEVQRAYEAGQAMLEREDQRIKQLISAVRGA